MMAPDDCVIFQGVGEDQTSRPPPSGSAHAYILQCTIKGYMASNKSKETSVSTNWSNYYTPRKLCLWWVYCFHVVRASVHPSVRPSVTLCFLNIFKSHCWIFIKPCKHVHICKTNTLNKNVRARELFPFVVLNGFLYRVLCLC